MTVSIVPVNTAIENFFSLFTKINLLIDLANQYAVTVDLTANGSVSTGNGFVNGIFAANTFAANVIRGGNVQSEGTLAIYANTWSLGNSTVNTVANSTQITALNITLGNTTVGFMANTSAIRLNGTTYTNLVPHVIVANNGSTIGDQPKINLIQGNNVTLEISDHAGGSQVNVIINATGGGGGNASVAGSNTHIQYNDSGAMGGSAGFTFDKTTNNVSIANSLAVTMINFPQARLSQIYANTSTTSEEIIDSFFLADFRAAKYFLSVKDNTVNAFQSTELLVLHSGGQAYLTEYATVYSNLDIAAFTATVNATHVRLGYTPVNNNTSVKGFRHAIAVSV